MSPRPHRRFGDGGRGAPGGPHKVKPNLSLNYDLSLWRRAGGGKEGNLPISALASSLCVQLDKKSTTLSGGSLGSCVDEERS